MSHRQDRTSFGRIPGLVLLAALIPACGGGGGGASLFPTLLGITSDNSPALVRVDPTTGAPSTVSGAGLMGCLKTFGLAYVAASDTLYAVDNDRAVLLTMDRTTGRGTVVGHTGVPLRGLAYVAATGILYACDQDSLYRVDRATGAATLVGGTGFSSLTGLAYHTGLSTLFALSTTANRLLSLNTATGLGTDVGALGVTYMTGFTYDAASNQLYATSIGDYILYTLNPATGAATAGPTHYSDVVRGLAPGAGAGQLYAIDGLDGELIVIATATGGFTRLAAVGFGDIRGLAFSPSGGTLYGINSRTGRLLTISLPSAEGTEVGPSIGSFGNNYHDMAVDPAGPTYYVVNASNLVVVDPTTGLGTQRPASGAGLLRGLAFDPAGPTLYATSDQDLYTLNPATGAATLIGSLGAGVAVWSLEMDPDSGLLIGIDNNANRLVQINPSGPIVTPLERVSGGGYRGLARHPLTGDFYSVLGSIVRIDRTTRRESFPGSLSPNARAFAYDPAAGVGYALLASQGTLLRVHPLTGEATAVNEPGAAALANISGLVWSSSNSLLYGCDYGTNQLMTVNPATGAVANIGPFAATHSIETLALDETSGQLYGGGSAGASQAVLSINKLTGASTMIGSTSGFVRNLAFHPPTGRLLYGTFAFPKLVSLDPATAAETPLGTRGVRLSGLAYVPGKPTIGTKANPLVLTGYSGSSITYSGLVWNRELYIKVVGIPFLNNNHTVELMGMSDNANLRTFTDAFITLQQSSSQPGVANESCTGTTTATGELYILIDATSTTSGTSFTLRAGT